VLLRHDEDRFALVTGGVHRKPAYLWRSLGWSEVMEAQRTPRRDVRREVEDALATSRSGVICRYPFCCGLIS
jgi:hypothetical protein